MAFLSGREKGQQRFFSPDIFKGLFKEGRIEEVFDRHQGADDMTARTSVRCLPARALRK